MIAGCGGKNLRIAGPAEALAALRAVGGHVDEIGAQAPEGVLIEPVDLGVAGLDPADALEPGAEHAAAEPVLVQFADPALHAHIAEAEEGKVRTNGLPRAAGDVLKAGTGVPVVFVVEVPLLQDLPEVQGDFGSRWEVGVKLREAREILADIKATVRQDSVKKNEKIFTYGIMVIFIGCMLSVFQQIIGINAVLYFAPRIFASMGMDDPMFQTVLMGIINITFTLVAVFLRWRSWAASPCSSPVPWAWRWAPWAWP